MQTWRIHTPRPRIIFLLRLTIGRTPVSLGNRRRREKPSRLFQRFSDLSSCCKCYQLNIHQLGKSSIPAVATGKLLLSSSLQEADRAFSSHRDESRVPCSGRHLTQWHKSLSPVISTDAPRSYWKHSPLLEVSKSHRSTNIRTVPVVSVSSNYQIRRFSGRSLHLYRVITIHNQRSWCLVVRHVG
jgi:hypothetical protein